MDNLKRMKQLTISWAKEKREGEAIDLKQIEESLVFLESPEGDGYETEEKKEG